MYTKTSQLKRTKTSKVCIQCNKKRAIRFFEKPTSHKCKDCLMKNKRLKRLKDTEKSRLKVKAWKAFSDYIRTRDSIKTTGSKEHCVCVTCQKRVPYKKIQAGHFIGGRGNSILFDESVVNGQCLRCNIMLKGNYDEYNLVMLEKYGGKEVIEMLKQKKQVKQYSISDYKNIISLYQTKLKAL